MDDLKEKAILMYREFQPLYAEGIVNISCNDILVCPPLFKSFCPDSVIIAAEKSHGFIHLSFIEDGVKFVTVV